MGKEFLEMQQEASRRLREMQRRSVAATAAPITAKPSDPPQVSAPKKRKGPFSLFQAFDFSKLSHDGDGLILLVLLLLLTEEETDELLILALFYVMM